VLVFFAIYFGTQPEGESDPSRLSGKVMPSLLFRVAWMLHFRGEPLLMEVDSGIPVAEDSYAICASSSASRLARAISNSGERLAQCSGGRGFDHSMMSG